ncbi:MAG TPA: SRPBCC domain-containing protein [Solirubrobacterales bacterium]
MSGETLLIERTFQAPAQAVFDAWTSEKVMRRWFHGRHNWETPEAQVDLRLGGTVRVVMRDPEDGAEYGGGGHYTEIDPPTRLAFTWIWDNEPDIETLIEIDFEEADGATTVRFTHSRLRDQETVISHEGGWNSAFDSLEQALQEGETNAADPG